MALVRKVAICSQGGKLRMSDQEFWRHLHESSPAKLYRSRYL
jgi:hypothetical protein